MRSLKKSIKSLFSKRDLTNKQENQLLQHCLDNIDLSQDVYNILKDEIKCRHEIFGEDYTTTVTQLNNNEFPDFHPKLDLDTILLNQLLRKNKISGGKTKRRKRKKKDIQKKK